MRKITLLLLLGLLLSVAANVSAQVTKAPSPGDYGFSTTESNVTPVYSDFFSTLDVNHTFSQEAEGEYSVKETYTEVSATDDSNDKMWKLESFTGANFRVRPTASGDYNVSGKRMMHIDIYAVNTMDLYIAPMHWTGTTVYKKVSLTGGKWNAINIPMEYYISQGSGDFSTFYYFRLSGGDNGALADGTNTLYIDNLYFYNYTPNITFEATADSYTVESTDYASITTTTFCEGTVSYTYSVLEPANGGSVTSEGVYIGGTAGTQTTVRVTGTLGESSASQDIIFTNTTLTVRPTAAPSPGVTVGNMYGFAVDDANVKSVYSDYFTTNVGLGGENGSNATIEEITAYQNSSEKMLKVSDFKFYQVHPSAEFNITSSYLMFHIDIYSETATKLAVGPLTWNPVDMTNETKIVDVAGGTWTQIDVPVSYYGGTAGNNFYILKILDVNDAGQTTDGDGSKTFYIDNVYFYNYAQVLTSLDAEFPKMSTKTVKMGETLDIVPTALDQNGVEMSSDVTYTYSIVTAESTDESSSSLADATYTAGTQKTTTTVQVDAKQTSDNTKTATAKIVLKNVGDEPIITQLAVKSKDESSATLLISAAALVNRLAYTITCSADGETDRTFNLANVVNDAEFYYRVNGLTAGKTYTFTVKATATVEEKAYTSEAKTVDVTINTITAPASTTAPTTDQKNVMNLFSDTYKTSVLWKPVNGKYIQALYGDINEILPAEYVFYLQRENKVTETGEEQPLYHLATSDNIEETYTETAGSDNMMRITQLDHATLYFWADNAAGAQGYDCRPTAAVPLTSLNMDIYAQQAANIRLNFNNRLVEVVTSKDVSLTAGWNHITFDGTDFEKNPSLCSISIYGENGEDADAQNVLFIDNIYFISSVNTTFRQVKESITPLDGYSAADEKGIMTCTTDEKIKMAKFTGVFDLKVYNGVDDDDTHPVNTLLKDKTINWFDFREVAGLQGDLTNAGGLGGNLNAFMLTEPVNGTISNRGISWPYFSPNNIFMDDEGNYYATYMVIQLRQNEDYVPTNKNLTILNNSICTHPNWGNNIYNTLILPYDAKIPADAHIKLYYLESDYENTDGVDPQIRVYFKEVTETFMDGTEEKVILTANTPYLVVVQPTKDEEDNDVYTGNSGLWAKSNQPTLKFDPKPATMSVGGSNTLSFNGTYTTTDNQTDYPNTYVFKPATEGNLNTLAVARLSKAGTKHQYRCYFDFGSLTSAAKSNLMFYFKENNGGTTSVRLATEDEVKAIVGGIYSLDGKRVAENADEAQKIGLPKGVYVINGKKVVIK